MAPRYDPVRDRAGRSVSLVDDLRAERRWRPTGPDLGVEVVAFR